MAPGADRNWNQILRAVPLVLAAFLLAAGTAMWITAGAPPPREGPAPGGVLRSDVPAASLGTDLANYCGRWETIAGKVLVIRQDGTADYQRGPIHGFNLPVQIDIYARKARLLVPGWPDWSINQTPREEHGRVTLVLAREEFVRTAGPQPASE